MSLFFLQHPTEADMALFAGGEAGPLSRWRIENHIDHCDSCREVVADFFHCQSDLEQFSEVPEIDWNTLNRDIKASVKQTLTPTTVVAEPATKASGSWLRGRPAWGLAFASAAAFCGFIIFQEFFRDVESKTPIFRDVLKQQTGMQSAPFNGIENIGSSQRDSGKLQGRSVVPVTDSNSNHDWVRVTTRDEKFSLIPDRLRYEGAEIGVAADGSMSIRTLDSLTNTVTITHVYLP